MNRVDYISLLKSAAAIALLAGVFFVFYSPERDSQLSIDVSTNITPDATETVFRNSAGSFEFAIPRSWSRVGYAELPVGFSEPQFFLKKMGTDCVLSFASSPDNIRNLYDQASSGERIISTEGQFDPKWYIPRSITPKNFVIRAHKEIQFPYEFELVYYSNRQNKANAFVLFNSKGGVVDERCAQDVSSILKSVHAVFEPRILDNNSEGVARIDYSIAHKKSVLYFKAKNETLWKEVVAFSVNRDIAPVIYDDKIYFIDGGALKTLDPFSREIVPVPGIETTDQYEVNGMYFAKGNLYYLAGKYCAEYLGKCSLDLYEHNLQTHQSRILASGIKGYRIRGYKKDSDTLYISDDFGDGGCYSTKLFLYDFKTGLLRPGDSFGGCAEVEEEYVPGEAEKAYAVIDKYFETIAPYIGSFEIKGDKIMMPSGDQWANRGITLRFVR